MAAPASATFNSQTNLTLIIHADSDNGITVTKPTITSSVSPCALPAAVPARRRVISLWPGEFLSSRRLSACPRACPPPPLLRGLSHPLPRKAVTKQRRIVSFAGHQNKSLSMCALGYAQNYKLACGLATAEF